MLKIKMKTFPKSQIIVNKNNDNNNNNEKN